MISLTRLAVSGLILLALTACNGAKSDTDGGNQPGQGPAGCTCDSKQICVEWFDRTCQPIPGGLQCQNPNTKCGTSLCANCKSDICGTAVCCDSTDCTSGFVRVCRNAVPSKKYYTCTGL